ncbi:MAG: hypothetical protein PVJ43_08995 [Gemmatimonadales bacterium]|jgi:hypothetical protein
MKDATLGGYWREHERPPAFSGRDGDSYTVEIITECADAESVGPWCAYLFFLRWRGSDPVGHVESEVLAEADNEEAVRATLEKLTLHEVKVLLDRLVPE